MIDLEFYKAHATENDFVVAIDPAAQLQLSAPQIADVCERRSGIGGDGVIRMVPTSKVELTEQERMTAGVLTGEWFMDYRNADGSIAEMCGNGVRAMVECGVAAGIYQVGQTITVATRGGDKEVRVGAHKHRVKMGWPEATGQVAISGRDIHAVGNYYLVPNPHLVVRTERLASLELPQTAQSMFDYQLQPVLPNGVNVEFVEYAQPLTTGVEDTVHVRMRVAERGVGETRSCGTVCVAVGFDTYLASGAETVHVEVLGGSVIVTVSETEHTTFLEGPAAVVARLSELAPLA